MITESKYTFDTLAELNLDVIQGYTKAELHLCCKNLGLRGYSSLKKNELVERIYSATDIKRQEILALAKINEQEYKETLAAYREAHKAETSEGRLINKTSVSFAYDQNLTSSTSFVYYFWHKAVKRYAPLQLAKQCKKDLRNVFSEEEIQAKISKDYRESVLNQWGELVKGINLARREEEISKNKTYVYKAERVIQNTQAVIDWALNIIVQDNPKQNLLGLALAILSGRRQGEIFGSTEFNLVDGVIQAKGLLKKWRDLTQESYEFIVLCDPEDFMKGFAKLTKRGYTPKQVNDSISRAISREYPKKLFALGIEKFKDSRDFYASVVYNLFDNTDGVRKPAELTQLCMGHETGLATDYYYKFQTEVISQLLPQSENYLNRVKSQSA